MTPRRRPPDPFSQFFVAVALMAAFYLAILALVFQAVIVSLLPPNASFDWSTVGAGEAQSSASPVPMYR